MKYTAPSFSVNPSGAKAPENCAHGWVKKGRCVLCGEKGVKPPPVEPTDEAPSYSQGWCA